jgi:hypothetical protein
MDASRVAPREAPDFAEAWMRRQLPYCSRAIWESSEICAPAGVKTPITIGVDTAPHSKTAPVSIAIAARRTRWMKVMILPSPICPAARQISAARAVGSESMPYTLVPPPDCAPDGTTRS